MKQTIQRWRRLRDWQKRQIGDAYEKFIAENYFSFDEDGWTVEYSGINRRLEDLGRDLIVTREDECIIVQCKYLKQTTPVREKDICQLYGTTEAYKLDHPNQKVTAAFYTSTIFSPQAIEFAKKLNVEVHQGIKPKLNIFNTYKAKA